MKLPPPGFCEPICPRVEHDSHVVGRCTLPADHAGEHSLGAFGSVRLFCEARSEPAADGGMSLCLHEPGHAGPHSWEPA